MLDVVVNKPFIDNVKQLYSVSGSSEGTMVLSQLEESRSVVSFVCQWIIMAWEHISPEVTVKGLKKCCLSKAMDGTDDDMLWNGSEEDGNVKSECEEDWY